MLLTIAIPTYNRDEYVRTLVGDIAQEIDGLSGNDKASLDVMIIDNCSDEKTKENLRDLQNRYHWISLKSNAVNCGIEGNLITSIMSSEGRYTWLLSDHQRLLGGIVGKTIGILREKKPDLVCMGLHPWVSSFGGRPDGWCGPIGECTSKEVSALFFTLGNMSSLLARTELLRTDMRLCFTTAIYHYPHLAFIASLTDQHRVVSVLRASDLPSGEQVKRMSKSYNISQASFIDHLTAVRMYAHRTKLKWSTREFQTPDYRRALYGHMYRILALSAGTRWRTSRVFLRAAVVNRTSCIGWCSTVCTIAAVMYWLPLVIRKTPLLFVLRRTNPSSTMLCQAQ